MRGTVAWLLVGVLALSGCTDDSGESADGPSPSASASVTTAPETESPAPPEPTVSQTLSAGEFCEVVGHLVGGDEEKTRDATLELLQRGLPDELTGDAHDGLQVLLDHATEFGSARESWRAYRALEKGERGDLRALTWWVTKTCGKNYLDDLMPDLPRVPDLSDLLVDLDLPGRG